MPRERDLGLGAEVHQGSRCREARRGVYCAGTGWREDGEVRLEHFLAGEQLEEGRKLALRKEGREVYVF